MHCTTLVLALFLTAQATAISSPLRKSFSPCCPSPPVPTGQATPPPTLKTSHGETLIDTLARYLSEGFTSTISASLMRLKTKERRAMSVPDPVNHRSRQKPRKSFVRRMYRNFVEQLHRFTGHISLNGEPHSITERIAINATKDLDNLIVILTDTRNTLLKVALNRRPWYERIFLFFVNRRSSSTPISERIHAFANHVSGGNTLTPVIDGHQIVPKALSSLSSVISEIRDNQRGSQGQAATCDPTPRLNTVQILGIPRPICAALKHETRKRDVARICQKDEHAELVKISFKARANSFVVETNELLRQNTSLSLHQLWRRIFLSPYERIIDDILSFGIAQARSLANLFWRKAKDRFKRSNYQMMKTNEVARAILTPVAFYCKKSLQVWIRRFHDFVGFLFSHGFMLQDNMIIFIARSSSGIFRYTKSSLAKYANHVQMFYKRVFLQIFLTFGNFREFSHRNAFETLIRAPRRDLQKGNEFSRTETQSGVAHVWIPPLNSSNTMFCNALSFGKDVDLPKSPLVCKRREGDKLIEIADRILILLKELVKEGLLLLIEIIKYSSDFVFIIGGAALIFQLVLPVFFACVHLAWINLVSTSKAVYTVLFRTVSVFARFFMYIAWIYSYCVEFLFRLICIALYDILWPNRRATISSQTAPSVGNEVQHGASHDLSQPESESAEDVWEDACDSQAHFNENVPKNVERYQETRQTMKRPIQQKNIANSMVVLCDENSVADSSLAASDENGAADREAFNTDENSSIVYVSTTNARKRVDPDVAFALRVLDRNRAASKRLEKNVEGDNSVTRQKIFESINRVKRQKNRKLREQGVVNISDSDTSAVVESVYARHTSPENVPQVTKVRKERGEGHDAPRLVRRKHDRSNVHH